MGTWLFSPSVLSWGWLPPGIGWRPGLRRGQAVAHGEVGHPHQVLKAWGPELQRPQIPRPGSPHLPQGMSVVKEEAWARLSRSLGLCCLAGQEWTGTVRMPTVLLSCGSSSDPGSPVRSLCWTFLASTPTSVCSRGACDRRCAQPLVPGWPVTYTSIPPTPGVIVTLAYNQTLWMLLQIQVTCSESFPPPPRSVFRSASTTARKGDGPCLPRPSPSTARTVDGTCPASNSLQIHVTVTFKVTHLSRTFC